MKNAVAILNWNGEKLLKQFLPKVIKHSPQADIYVIDNASTDNSLELLKTEFPSVKIILLDKNYGFAGGYNRGIKQIDADNIVLLNSDVEVTKDWLSPIIDHLHKFPQTVAIQPKIKDYKNKKMFEYAGAAGGYLDFFGYPYCDGRLLFSIEEDKGQYDRKKEIFWGSGACLAIRKNDFCKVGGFDESYFAHQEEIDLCWRLKQEGAKIMYIPESTVYHIGGASLNNLNPYKTYLNFRNNLITLLKNLPSAYLFPVIFIRLLLDGLAGIFYLLKGRPSHTWAIVKAHFGFYKRIPEAWKKRNSKQIKNYYNRFSIFIK
jgi:GT2 family glycosyltransferase